MSDPDDIAKAAQRLAEQVAKLAGLAAAQASKHVERAAAATLPILQQTAEQTWKAAGQLAEEAQRATAEAIAAAQTQLEELQRDPGKALPLDELGRRMATLGTPAIMFAVAASIAGAAGLAGGAVITAALAMLGGPAGMLGGLALLGVAGLIADAVLKHGIDTVLTAAYQARLAQGESREHVAQEIDTLWISDDLKLKLKHVLGLTGSGKG